MKSKNYKLLLTPLLLTLAMLSYSQEDINIDFSSTKWEVVKIKKDNDSSFFKAENSYILEFTSDSTFALNLDVNNCFGQFEMQSEANVSISPAGCSKRCCDTEFAESLQKLLPKMTRYYGKGDRLIFEGDGEVVLKKQ